MAGKKKAIKKEVKKEVKKDLKKTIAKRPNLKKVSMRKRTGAIHGRGGYWSDLGRSIGGGLGSAADSIISVGKAVTGVGDYSIKSNSLMETGGPPRIRNSKHSSIVHHEEYLCDIKGSVNFRIAQYPINPGVTSTFPWLASQAAAYEQWRPRGIIFSFRSSAGDAISSTNNAEGMIIMATEYNSNLPPFSNKQEMEDHEYRTAVKPSCNGLHGIECARGLTPLTQLYIRSGSNNGSNSANYNPLSYDLGQFYIATQGMQVDDITIGELWVSYELEFYKPTLSPVISNNIYQHWYWDSVMGDPPQAGQFFRNLRNVNTGETTSATANVLTGFNPGSYVMAIVQSNSAGNITLPNYTNFTLTNGIFVPFTQYSTTTAGNTTIGFPAGQSSTSVMILMAANFTGVGAITYSSGYTAGTISSFDVHLFPIGSGLQARSRKAVDWDPFAKISRRIDDLCRRLGFEDFQRVGCRSGSLIEDEKYYCPPPSPTSPKLLDRELPDLSRSQVDFATSLLTRLGAGRTSKTGSHVTAA